jgi:hypothetical protein
VKTTSNILVELIKLSLYGSSDSSGSSSILGVISTTSNILVGSISDTSNYVRYTSNIISKRITDLNTDMITELPDARNRFIVNDEYKRDLTINGDLTITSNLTVYGNNTTLYTYVYTAENLEVVNINVNSVALMVQQSNSGRNDIFVASNQSDRVFNISNNGDVNIIGSYRKNNRDVVEDTSNYVKITSNILVTNTILNNTNTSNYIAYTSNILVLNAN